VKLSRRDDFKSVIVKGDTDRAAAAGVVAMHEGVGQRFPQGLDGKERGVLSLEFARNDSTCHGQPVDQEALGATHQVEGVAVELPVVEKLAPIGTLESCDAQVQLRKIWLRDVALAEQRHCGACQFVSRDQEAEATQDRQGVARTRIIAAPSANRFFQRDDDFVVIQFVDRPAGGGLCFPTISGVQGFEHQALVGGARHDARGVQGALIRHPAKRYRPQHGLFDMQADQFSIVGHGYPFDAGQERRFESVEFCGEFF
jgi:hypothetical protein